jgi:nucleoside-diphosphate-sugar epimerase
MSHDNAILVLGAGELGMAVLRNLVQRAAPAGTSVAVLLRPSTIDPQTQSNRRMWQSCARWASILSPGI